MAIFIKSNNDLIPIKDENSVVKSDLSTVATSGNYKDLIGTPTELPAADVHEWAKAENKPSYSAAEVGAMDVSIKHLEGDIATTEKGTADGVATLGSDGKVPASQLPSYVDDVLEYKTLATFPQPGESGKIYVETTTNKTYRWSGSDYVEISPSIVIGSVTGTAFDGKIGTDHINNKTNPHNVTKAQVGLENVENKNSETIRSEITSKNVTDALGYTPLDETKTPTTLPASDVYPWAKAEKKPAYTAAEVGALPSTTKIPTTLPASDVYPWAKAENKPAYTAAEVGALPADTKIPSEVTDAHIKDVIAKDTTVAKTSQIPTTLPASDVRAWAKADVKPSYTASEVGLGNVGNFKAVSTVANQGLSETEKTNARNNIGAGTSSFSGNYNDLSNKPNIPSAVTEATVSGWGFTKNTGTYSKPNTGIPKTDLASAVQTSLDKADTALQSHQSLAGYATETWVNQQGFKKTDNNTTYSLTQDATDKHKITLTPSSGTAQTITIPDNNTWRPVVNNLTSAETDQSLSANQGKILNDKFGSYLPKSGGTMTGALGSSLTTGTHLAGNKGTAIINSTAAGNGYTMLAKMNSLNGVWTLGGWTNSFNLFYTSKDVVDKGTNTITKRLILLDESGDTSLPGTLTIGQNATLSFVNSSDSGKYLNSSIPLSFAKDGVIYLNHNSSDDYHYGIRYGFVSPNPDKPSYTGIVLGELKNRENSQWIILDQNTRVTQGSLYVDDGSLEVEEDLEVRGNLGSNLQRSIKKIAEGDPAIIKSDSGGFMKFESGKLMICWGVADVRTVTDPLTVVFPSAFSSTPIVTLGSEFRGDMNADMGIACIASRTARNFVLTSITARSGFVDLLKEDYNYISWIAIGSYA